MMNFCTPKPRTKKRGITIKSENKGKTPNKVKRKNVIYIASIINSPLAKLIMSITPKMIDSPKAVNP